MLLIFTLCIPQRICVCLYMSMYSQCVNQFIMRCLVSELAGEEREQTPASGWKASQSREPSGWGWLHGERWGHSRWEKLHEQTRRYSKWYVYCNSSVVRYLPFFWLPRIWVPILVWGIPYILSFAGGRVLPLVTNRGISSAAGTDGVSCIIYCFIVPGPPKGMICGIIPGCWTFREPASKLLKFSSVYLESMSIMCDQEPW